MSVMSDFIVIIISNLLTWNYKRFLHWELHTLMLSKVTPNWVDNKGTHWVCYDLCGGMLNSQDRICSSYIIKEWCQVFLVELNYEMHGHTRVSLYLIFILFIYWVYSKSRIKLIELNKYDTFDDSGSVLTFWTKRLRQTSFITIKSSVFVTDILVNWFTIMCC
jgi:hypothetical protein